MYIYITKNYINNMHNGKWNSYIKLVDTTRIKLTNMKKSDIINK